MKKLLLFLILVIIGCTPTENEKSTQTREDTEISSLRNADSLKLRTIVYDFFKAFDERNLQKINDLLIPTTTIIHHNGVATNTQEMIKIIETTKNWWQRTRTLSSFEYTINANLAVVGLINEVTFSLPDNKKVIEKYNETWIFEKIASVWKPVRIHYSKVMADKHSEEVE